MISQRHDLPLACFPVTIEALHPFTRAVVWSEVVPAPQDFALLIIPPLKKQLGHHVLIRITYADGTKNESKPENIQ